ncbi:hypothetical protein [Marinimicrobium sp. C2-29]|uniref:hypothetical protein n=1 Tax=Marinimicrobium sp. C2-29 TaxID=3139825 RepID=UPI0031395208
MLKDMSSSAKSFFIGPTFSILVMLTCLAATPTLASDFTGFLSLETRLFPEEALHPDQSDASISVASDVEYFRDWDDYRQRLVVSGFARADSSDEERTHADIRQLYWWRQFDSAELYLGARQVFWGVTESVHLVDVINQDDLVENIDGEDKLGQPMISALTQRSWGTLELYALLGFRERTFPGREGRLRTPVVVDGDSAQYQAEEGDDHIDFAMRWSKVLGDWDVGASHFSGTSRDPILLPVGSAGDVVALTPYYPLVEQTGIDLQMTKGAWLWKLEAISLKEKEAQRNTAAVGGFEYSLFGVGGSSSDLGVLLEYQFDDRRGIRETANQNDLALGARWMLNDFKSTELLALVSVDLDSGSRFFSFEGSRRLNDSWSLEAEVRVFSNVSREDPIYAFRADDYIQLDLRRYF